MLRDVQRLLRGKLPVHLISTQLIEAGVDIDFPVVYRAMAPADSVVQAAGRCNRNGDMRPLLGRVVVFDPESGGMPGRTYQGLAEATRFHFVGSQAGAFDDPTALHAYYQDIYAAGAQIRSGANHFADLRGSGDFPETAKEFRMIKEDSSVEVVVTAHPDPQVAEHVANRLQWLRENPLSPVDRSMRRFLAPYTANVARTDAEVLGLQLPQGLIEWAGDYDSRQGALGAVGTTW